MTAESDSDMIDVKSELNCQGLEYELSSDPVENLVDDILMALILICWRTSKNMTSEANWKVYYYYVGFTIANVINVITKTL